MIPDISMILKSLFLTLILLNIKSFPLAYHVRFIPMLIKSFKNKNVEGRKKDLFQIFEYKRTVFFDDVSLSYLEVEEKNYNN